jgi:hypothetical protein
MIPSRVIQLLLDQMDIPVPTNILYPDPANPVDAVSRLAPDNYAPSPNILGKITREHYIRSKFGPIEANPHRNDNTLSITRVYAILDPEIGNETTRSNVVNANADQLLRFISDIVNIAKQAGDVNRETAAPDPTQVAKELGRAQHVLLYGPRGCGKTFLLNYLLSEFSETFDHEKLLWIRINLNEDFGDPPVGDYQQTLHHYILAQLTKIVFRYYDPNSEFYTSKPYPIELGSILRDQSTDPVVVANMEESFTKKGQDPPISPSLIPFWLALRVSGVVLREGYSVVAILDNLDRLEAEARHRGRFRAIFRAASQLVLTGLGNLGMAVVSVTRDDTLRRIETINLPMNHPFLQGQAIRWKVEAAPLEKVLGQRMSFVETRVPSIAPDYQWNMEDWSEHLTGLKACVAEIGRDGGAEVQLFGANLRAQMQTMQLRYENSFRGAHYALIEDLILAGQLYPPRVYRYETTQSGSHLRFERLGNNRFDNHLLPSVFEYPMAIGFTPQNGQAVHPEGLLQGLRVLQLVAAAERLHGDGFEYVVENEVKQILQVVFDYSSETTAILMEQFREYEMLRSTNVEIGISLSKGETGRVRLAEKGRLILEYYIYQLAYLGLWAMRVPTGDAGGEHTPGFFVAASLRDGRMRGSDVQLGSGGEVVRWVGTKAINATGMVRAIRGMNEIQRGRYERDRVRIRSDRGRMILGEAVKGGGNVAGMFACAEEMIARVKGQMDAMVRSVTDGNPAGEEALGLMVEEWVRRWQ